MATLPARAAKGAVGVTGSVVLLLWITHEWSWAVAHPEG